MGVGSIAVGAWLAPIVLAVLVLQALIEQRFRLAGIAVVLGLACWLVVGRINPLLITSAVAILDIGLVFAVFGRDIRIN